MKPGWQVRPLGEVCEIVSGGTPSKGRADFWKGDIPWVSPKDMKSEVITDSEDHISEAAVQGSATRMVKEGSLLIVVRSGILSRTIPVSIAGRDLTINQDIKALIPGKSVESRYLALFLEAQEAELLGRVTRGATVHKLDTPVIRSLPIPVPPLDEQRRIVAVLDDAFEGLSRARANTEANLADARELFEQHLKEAFAARQNNEPRKTVGDVIVLQRGTDITKSQQGSGQVPVVSSGGIRSYHDEAIAKGPGVVVGRKGSIGSVYFVESDFWPHDTTLWVKDFKGNSPKLVFYLLSALDLKGLDTGAANPSLNRNLVHLIPITWPDSTEQDSLVHRIESLESAIDALKSGYREQLDDLDALRQTLLQRAFAGELT